MPTLFELAIDVPAWLAADADTPYAERLRRDRSPTTDAAPEARVRAWWEARRPTDVVLPGARLQRLRRVAVWLLVALGAVTGAGAAGVLFAYDGSEPVNLAQVLGVFVVLQLILALLAVLLLPMRLPVLRDLQDLIADLTPGGLATALLRRLAGGDANAELPLGWHAARLPAAADFARWQAFYLSQCAGLAFNIAAVVTAAAMITFSDLAFAWSTTLDVDAADVQAVTHLLSLPFGWLLPAAVPDLTLIDASQFNRAAGIHALPAAETGRWWPFVLACMITWGVLPRVVLLALARWRLWHATRTLLLQDPRVTALLDRMDTPVLEQRPEGIEPGPQPAAVAGPEAGEQDASRKATVVIWSAATTPGELAAQLRPLGLVPGGIHRAGGDASVEQDAHTVEMVAAARPSRVVIVTRAWEPPMLEMLDFAADLRAAAPDASITFVPLPPPGEALQDSQLATWKQAVARLADARVYVEATAP